MSHDELLVVRLGVSVRKDRRLDERSYVRMYIKSIPTPAFLQTTDPPHFLPLDDARLFANHHAPSPPSNPPGSRSPTAWASTTRRRRCPCWWTTPPA